MELSKEEILHYYHLYWTLLYYANKTLEVLENVDSPKDISQCSLKDVAKLRYQLFDQPELIDDFIQKNPMSLSRQDLDIIASWKNCLKGRFFIVRHLKKYTVFLDAEDPPRAYGVLGLYTPLKELIDPSNLPVFVEAVLLPFENKIVYDGILAPSNIIIGKGISRGLDDKYNEAKMRFGIITALPFHPEKTEPSDAEKLKIYLKNENSREIHWEEIGELIHKDPELMALYHQEMGKVYARTYRRRLRDIGIEKGWFAVTEGLIIAGATTKDEVERILQDILPAEKRMFVYVFQLKR
ncbi:hypothetical protein [Candidatus Methanocrinis natronophilus]|uniref:DUF2971 domain-containing protein n=1 Tax=Candidatus Methanocrinis natronophilus TaxID=3033396 RepID=A0ABT5X9Y7_9EURY|nr:hypothetical protein [Candidatus Methanocrinis natronophilus]MDF0591486.1 hypothetical protein [Candidatus Methanocrinis natronophilus]